MATNCRFCGQLLVDKVLDLGLSPISNEFRPAITAEHQPQTYYPLAMMVCRQCWLAQLADVTTPQHFNAHYAYFSSYSQSWLQHSQNYAQQMIARLRLSGSSQVVEVASNDGYLLQYFKAAGIPTLGIEPSANVAEAAIKTHGIPTLVKFFNKTTAAELTAEGTYADLIAANNVLAHVPDPNHFLAGFKLLLKPLGTATFEFPHLLRLVTECQFDTIYHEHYSYLSLGVVERMLAAHQLEAYDVEELTTHGGSLRVYVRHRDASVGVADGSEMLRKVRANEAAYGLEDLATYRRFGEEMRNRKFELLSFLIDASRSGKRVAGYGAPAKGNTLLNYCGIGPELLPYTVDRNPYKQEQYLPGVNIPVSPPERILEERPDYVLILPWNLRDEIMAQLASIKSWGGRFVVAIPRLEILP
ncbi:MAG TPA: class I SAM-dependent methyltransferase [Terriglobales bacterium]|nr:class I SAM-dependent methyltransferase [Terriglobales bacterium]